MTELEEYISLCKGMKWQSESYGKELHYCLSCKGATDYTNCTPECIEKKQWIYIAPITQLIEMLGDRFDSMYFTNKTEWCVTFQSKMQDNGMYMIETVKGQSARIALIKAVKEVKDARE